MLTGRKMKPALPVTNAALAVTAGYAEQIFASR
jgi:hypothetical protein